MESDLAQRMDRLGISLLSIVASSSAFRLPASPPPKGSSIDSDWSTKNKKQPGFLRLISAWYAMVFLHLFLASRNYCLIAPTGRTRRDPDHRLTGLRRGVAESPSADNGLGRRNVEEAHAGPLQTSALPLGYGAVSLKLASYLDFLNPPSSSSDLF